MIRKTFTTDTVAEKKKGLSVFIHYADVLSASFWLVRVPENK